MDDLGLHDIIEAVGRALAVVGVAIIAAGAVVATVAFLRELRNDPLRESSIAYRRNLSRSLLLGLEFLVAADVIETVAVEATLRSVAVLAGVVALRTSLSLTLEMEMSGRWLWQRAPGVGG